MKQTLERVHIVPLGQLEEFCEWLDHSPACLGWNLQDASERAVVCYSSWIDLPNVIEERLTPIEIDDNQSAVQSSWREA